MSPEQWAAVDAHRRRLGIAADDVIVKAERHDEVVLLVGTRKGRERTLVLDGQGNVLRYGR